MIPESFPCMVAMSKVLHLTDRWEICKWLLALRRFSRTTIEIIRQQKGNDVTKKKKKKQEGDNSDSQKGEKIALKRNLFFKPILNPSWKSFRGTNPTTVVDSISICRRKVQIIMEAYERLWMRELAHELILFPVGAMCFPDNHQFSAQLYEMLESACKKYFYGVKEPFLRHVPILVYPLLSNDDGWSNSTLPLA